jgi:hypothetical protein
MTLHMTLCRGRAAPCVSCDVCCVPIRLGAGSGGNYRFAVYPDQRDAPIFFEHKRCTRAFERTHPLPYGAQFWAWGPLEALPIWIGDVLQLDWRQARQHARAFEQIA